jgi:rhodanese-related sulfurtransferase
MNDQRVAGGTIASNGEDHVDVPEIDVAALADVLATGAVLIDVRELDEFEEARVPGGTLIPLATVPERLAEIPGSGAVYVVCRSGGRSRKACEFLRARGVDAINVGGGTLAWIESGRAVDRGPAS